MAKDIQRLPLKPHPAFPSPSVRQLWSRARWIDSREGREKTGSILTGQGRILGVGKEDELLRRFGAAEERYDLEGRLLLPGWTDAHCHLLKYGVESTRSADLTGSRSLEEVRHRLERHAETRTEEWVLGHGFDQDLLAEHRYPNRDDLDAWFPERPALIQRICCHALVASSAALSLAGVRSEDGLLTEDAMSPLLSTISQPSLEEMIEAARFAVKAYNATGFTGAHVLIGHPDEVRALSTLHRKGELTIRIQMIVPYSWIDSLERTGLASAFRGEFLQLSGVKSFGDGSLGARTAALRTPYSDAPHHSGQLLLTSDDLVNRIRRSHGAGLRTAVHAIGDAAVEALISAAEQTTGEGPPPRMEHASVVDPVQAGRMGRIGMSAAIQPQFVASDFWIPERLGVERTRWAYAFRTLKEAGVNLAASTDCPIEKPIAGEVFNGLVRRADHRDGEALSPDEALRALSVGADRSMGAGENGLRAGDAADFVILLAGVEWPLSNCHNLPMEHMIIGGKIVR